VEKSGLPLAARQFNPRTGETTALGPVSGERCKFTPPNEEDWVLVVK
jgi:hypothetical protein